MKINQDQFYSLVCEVIRGGMSNPLNVGSFAQPYTRQALVNSAIEDVDIAITQAGIIKEWEPKSGG